MELEEQRVRRFVQGPMIRGQAELEQEEVVPILSSQDHELELKEHFITRPTHKPFTGMRTVMACVRFSFLSSLIKDVFTDDEMTTTGFLTLFAHHF